MSAATDAFVAQQADRFVEEWRAICRIPSVSGSLDAIEQAAQWIEARLEPLFDEVRRIEIPGHGPLLAATLNGSGDGRLLLYTHYDVQPPGDPGQWTTPAFAAELRDGKMWARGACDDKADVVARLHALEAWVATLDGAPPPYTVIYISDPAEEIGSPGLAEALAANAASLHADACLWESFLRDGDGRPGIGFGCRGNLEVRLDLRLLRSDQHTAFASVVRSAPLELMRAVSSLTDGRGSVTIDGFLDGALAPTPEQVETAARIPLPVDAVTRAGEGVSPFWPGASEQELRQRLIFAPSLSVSQFIVGADGVGSVPAEASVTLRFSLVPDQDPAHVLATIERHLAAHGFGDIQVTAGRAILPAASPLDTPFARATIDAARDTMGEPVVYPVLIGAGPGRIVLDALGAPVVSPAGTLRPDGNMHGPDEHGAVADYLDHVRFTARLFERLAENGF
ncbi:M20/M25/M40 family metallo-hydrolase [Conexibacter sp. JD483]|uniref:M20/M25/M40 family metallo-hydrolase n=1 Tax=unclassified Conexibacter TaxID=2627773 RepID=UPI002715B209|nr:MULTISPECIES: M20/M25/M40 family metallo-hydrolase [unclassified Conexibacter]MDO8185583.1 M20/M25/M40 family metallo-hydrolase [Conexibacter sp. CPCC 205706]MDO8198756.1 M20/M25/M40 family metallo-hydrolase [Conexibacter sp. CPCC 205762]MDR9367894.1 M20/M25/M40 family metallo-hydrolase [Conexibacter sp. JD483]